PRQRLAGKSGVGGCVPGVAQAIHRRGSSALPVTKKGSNGSVSRVHGDMRSTGRRPPRRRPTNGGKKSASVEAGTNRNRSVLRWRAVVLAEFEIDLKDVDHLLAR